MNAQDQSAGRVRQALHDITVIDIGATPATAWCSRLLAAFGAEVLLVEPREGHPIRGLAPFDEDGASIPAAYLLAGKRSVELDLAAPPGRQLLDRLLERADVLISSSGPSRLRDLNLSYGDLARPSLVMAHITAHGMTGPLADTPGNDLTVAARSGWASINGMDGREPLKPAAWQSSLCAGVVAAGGVMAALRHRDAHPGEGQEVDVSETEVMTAMFAPALLRSQYEGVLPTRPVAMNLTEGPVPVEDGYFALTLSRAHFWRDAMNLLELPDLAEDPRWESASYRRANQEEYTSRVEERMTHWRKMDLFEELAVRRVVAGPVLTMEELVENEHLRARGFWQHPADAPDAPERAGVPFKMSQTPLEIGCAARAVGQDTAEVEASLESEMGA